MRHSQNRSVSRKLSFHPAALSSFGTLERSPKQNPCRSQACPKCQHGPVPSADPWPAVAAARSARGAGLRNRRGASSSGEQPNPNLPSTAAPGALGAPLLTSGSLSAEQFFPQTVPGTNRPLLVCIDLCSLSRSWELKYQFQLDKTWKRKPLKLPLKHRSLFSC